MNQYEQKRYDTILEIAKTSRTDEELAGEVCQLLDKEVRAAYGRGIRDGGKSGRQTPKRNGYPSAVKHGKLRPVHDPEEIQAD